MGKSAGKIRLLGQTWTGAGFSLFVLILVMLHLSEYDLYDLSRMLSWPLLAIFYGYGIACSFVLHLLALRYPRLNGVPLAVLHGLLGFVFFILRGIDSFALFAGCTGALFAVVFYFGVRLAGRHVKFVAMFAIIAPMLVLFAMQMDFSVKKGWHASLYLNGYVAAFERFNGEHAIPLQLEEGEAMAVRIQFDAANEGGYGYRVRTKRNKPVPMEPIGDGHFVIRPEKTGEYAIIVTGDDLSGSFSVAWEPVH